MPQKISQKSSSTLPTENNLADGNHTEILKKSHRNIPQPFSYNGNPLNENLTEIFENIMETSDRFSSTFPTH